MNMVTSSLLKNETTLERTSSLSYRFDPTAVSNPKVILQLNFSERYTQHFVNSSSHNNTTVLIKLSAKIFTLRLNKYVMCKEVFMER